MEPDIEKIISNRIREAEMSPVNWNKSLTWNKINNGKNSRRFYFFPYYAAASVLIASLLYFLNRDEVQINNSSQVAVADPAKREKPFDNVAEFKEEKIDVPDPVMKETKVATAVKALAKEQLQKSKKAVSEDEIVSMPEEMNIAESIVPDYSHAIPDETTLAAEKKVEPIIGVLLPEEESEVRGKNKKRNRIYKLASSGQSSFDEGVGKNIVLARIK